MDSYKGRISLMNKHTLLLQILLKIEKVVLKVLLIIPIHQTTYFELLLIHVKKEFLWNTEIKVKKLGPDSKFSVNYWMDVTNDMSDDALIHFLIEVYSHMRGNEFDVY